MAAHLSEFRELAKEVVRGACRTTLLEAGFTPDDYFYATESTGTKVTFKKQFQGPYSSCKELPVVPIQT